MLPFYTTIPILSTIFTNLQLNISKTCMIPLKMANHRRKLKWVKLFLKTFEKALDKLYHCGIVLIS